MMGRVVYGRQIGRTIGIPTVNIRLQRYKAALSGVFAVTVDGLGGTRLGAANIGVRPTVAVDGRPSKEPLLEVHIFDFDEEVYGRSLDRDAQVEDPRRTVVPLAAGDEGRDRPRRGEDPGVLRRTPASTRERAVKRWYGLAAGVLALDQATKAIAMRTLTEGFPVDVLPFLSWTLTYNTGAAFSLFEGLGGVIAVVAAGVSVYLIIEIWRLREGWLEGAAYGLILAGALGNLTDRLRHGQVVDFVHVHYDWFNFPVFNVADSAITVGAAAWIWLLIMDARRGSGRSREGDA